jgi:hypothetical protein
LLALLLFSCTNDELENNSTNPVINQLKNNLKLDEFTNRNIAENLVVNWETFFKIEKEGFEIYEIGITETDEVKITSKLFQESLQYELIAIKKNAVTYSYLIQAFSSIQNDLYTGTIQKSYNYTGTLNVFDLQGKELGQLLIHNGVPTNPSNNSKLAPLALAIKLFSPLDKNGLTNKLPSCDNTYSFSTLFTHHYDDRYEIWSNAVTGEVYTVKFLGREYIRTTTSLMSVSYPCESQYSNDEIHIPYIRKSYKTINYEISDVIEDKIDYSQLDPCPKAVMDKLKNATNNDIKAILDKLGAGSNVYKLNIISGNANGLPEISTSTIPFSYTTTISTDYTKATSLFRASNLLYEFAHVYFMSIVDDFRAKGYPQTDYNLNSFPSLFQAFCDQEYSPTQTIAANAHHLEMANKYVDAIASSLKEYDKSNNSTVIIPDQVYIDLAWGGLMDAPVFSEKFPQGSNDAIRIRNRYSCESAGFHVRTESPIGKPCN